MALEDFYGTYRVETASGTEFGLNTTVIIKYSEAAGTIEVSFTPPGTEEASTPVIATYQNETDSLHIAMADDTQMFISRFAHPEYDDYYSIYGMVVTPREALRPHRIPVWSAECTDCGTRAASPVSESPLPQAFEGTYVVKTTADAQFGCGSEIIVTSERVEIRNALETSVVDAPLAYNAGTVAVIAEGATEVEGPLGPKQLSVTMAMSLALVEEKPGEEKKKYVYGHSTIGDPYQGGTFGGEEESGGSTASFAQRFSKPKR